MVTYKVVDDENKSPKGSVVEIRFNLHNRRVPSIQARNKSGHWDDLCWLTSDGKLELGYIYSVEGLSADDKGFIKVIK